MVKIELNNLRVDIDGNRVKSEKLIGKKDVYDLIEFLKYQIQVLTTFHDGVSMGIKSIENDIDEKGHYTKHGYVYCGANWADLP